MIQGKDIIGQARTGTGKTAAFGIPLLEKLTLDKRIQALVLVPTRELAVQVCKELTSFDIHNHFSILPVYGGASMENQVRRLRAGTQVVVGTPGRIMDHMRQGTLRLDGVHTVVLDEADRMLDMGFIQDIDWILERTNPGRQTALFSATMPQEIKSLAARYMRDAVHINVSEDVLTVPECRQYFIGCQRDRKYGTLLALLKKEQPKLAIIFCSTKRMADVLHERLDGVNYPAIALHGNMPQAKRDRVMQHFRAGNAHILIATDLAARGLDIEGITHIINYDIPRDAKIYVHRIGRTARMGKSGIAYTLLTLDELPFLKEVQKLTNNALEREFLDAEPFVHSQGGAGTSGPYHEGPQPFGDSRPRSFGGSRQFGGPHQRGPRQFGGPHQRGPRRFDESRQFHGPPHSGGRGQFHGRPGVGDSVHSRGPARFRSPRRSDGHGQHGPSHFEGSKYSGGPRPSGGFGQPRGSRFGGPRRPIRRRVRRQPQQNQEFVGYR